MDERRILLKHFLAALAYRTQKSPPRCSTRLRRFPRRPRRSALHTKLIRHMDSVLGYSRTYFLGGSYQPPTFTDFSAAITHFHEILTDVAHHIELGTELHGITPEILLQGPFSDAMTHAGQLALLRRLSGSPVPPEKLYLRRHHPRKSQPQPTPTPQPRQGLARENHRPRNAPLLTVPVH